MGFEIESDVACGDYHLDRKRERVELGGYLSFGQSLVPCQCDKDALEDRVDGLIQH